MKPSTDGHTRHRRRQRRDRGGDLCLLVREPPGSRLRLGRSRPADGRVLRRSRESKAFEGVAAIGAGYLLALVLLAAGHFLLFDALPFRWRADAAFTTLVLGGGAFVLFVPASCVVGAVLGGVGPALREMADGGAGA